MPTLPEIAARRRVVYKHKLQSKPNNVIAEDLKLDIYTVQNDIKWLTNNVVKSYLDQNQIAAFIFRVNLGIERIEQLLSDAIKDYENASSVSEKMDLRAQIIEIEKTVMNLSGEVTLKKLLLVERKILRKN